MAILKQGKAWLIDRIETRRRARAVGVRFTGVGICPICQERDLFFTNQNPEGRTQCGHCDKSTLTKHWKQPDE